MVDPNGLNKVLQAAQLNPEDTVLEIGAGLGSLTYLLAQQVKYVVAVELDKRLIPPLTKKCLLALKISRLNRGHARAFS